MFDYFQLTENNKMFLVLHVGLNGMSLGTFLVYFHLCGVLFASYSFTYPINIYYAPTMNKAQM